MKVSKFPFPTAEAAAELGLFSDLCVEGAFCVVLRVVYSRHYIIVILLLLALNYSV